MTNLYSKGPNFEEPLGVLNSDGDVEIPSIEPRPQPQGWAKADLERDHPVFDLSESNDSAQDLGNTELPESKAALQHRLSNETRIRGLGHIAAIKKSLSKKDDKDI